MMRAAMMASSTLRPSPSCSPRTLETECEALAKAFTPGVSETIFAVMASHTFVTMSGVPGTCRELRSSAFWMSVLVMPPVCPAR